MHSSTFLLPIFAHIAMTMGILAWLGFARVQAAKSGAVALRDIALDPANWPARIVQIGNSYKSQFELPLFFHILCILLYVRGENGWAFILLAWIFIFTRIIHAFIHVTSNHVVNRFNAFTAGLITLSLMWLLFAAQLLMIQV